MTIGDLPKLIVKNWIPAAIAMLAIMLLVLTTFFWWFETREHFPRMPEGSYSGQITGIFRNEQASAQFYLESSLAGEELLILMMDSGWQPQQVRLIRRQGTSSEVDRFYPITISSTDRVLKLIGERSEDSYHGKVFDLQNGRVGYWRAQMLDPRQVQSNASSSNETKLWLSLRDELQQIEHRLADVGEALPRQKEEIEKLRSYVEEGETLKREADLKFNQVQLELKASADELRAKQSAAGKLQAQVELAQRVTARGRLVSLARSTLEREDRWIASMLKSGRTLGGEDLDDAFKKAEAILDLKRQILIERSKIMRMESGLEENLPLPSGYSGGLS
ncbi:MAG: hypothetical protein KDD42_00535 [Bdellovibrionales bacterium]|nr:hypothetical protein [Bdellovibrionales bacterium]